MCNYVVTVSCGTCYLLPYLPIKGANRREVNLLTVVVSCCRVSAQKNLHRPAGNPKTNPQQTMQQQMLLVDFKLPWQPVLRMPTGTGGGG